MEEREYKTPSLKLLIINAVLFAITMIIVWVIYHNQDVASHGATYPWPAWIASAWGIAVVGHLCHVFFDNNYKHQDKYYEKYLYEKEN